MDRFFLAALVDEIKPLVEGRVLARLMVRGQAVFIDLRIADGAALVASLDPSDPGFLLSRKAFSATNLDWRTAHPFAEVVRKRLVGAVLVRLTRPGSDRVVQLDFEYYEAGGNRLTSSLVFTLTGRSSNAYLTGASGLVDAVLFDRGRYRKGDPLESVATADNLLGSISRGEGAITKEGAESLFAPWGVFGPSLRTEFHSRCLQLSPVEAVRSIAADLADRPVGLVYSTVPLGNAGDTMIDLKRGLLLSRLELVSATDLERCRFGSLSEAADAYYLARRLAKELLDDYTALMNSLRDRIKKLEKLVKAVEEDRRRFDNPEALKRYGDLILANLADARVSGSIVRVRDFYDPAAGETEIEIDPGKSLQQNAAKYFSRYQKSRRAFQAINNRLVSIGDKRRVLAELLLALEARPSREEITRVREELHRLGGKGPRAGESGKQSSSKAERQVGRRFLSSQGYEIIVGRNDRENDWITFRLARSQDVWLHAADYPGSHVVIKNPGRHQLPQQTIIEAAELAAFYSQASQETKAAVHFTEKKFVSKPPKARPGLVRLSSFKTALVEPRCNLMRIE